MTVRRQVGLVIGGTKGIGAAIARSLSAEGVEVTVVGRDVAAGNALADELGGHFLRADVSLLTEARRVAAVFASSNQRLHYLIQTADVLPARRRETGEGFEVSFATNYLSRFVLNGRLLPLLTAAGADPGGARIVHVAGARGSGKLDPAKVPPSSDVAGLASHGLGQTANDVYGVELAQRLQGTGVRVHVLNPGGVDTGIRAEVETTTLGRVLFPVMGLLMKVRTAEESARSILGAIRAYPNAVLIDAKGRPIRPHARLSDSELRDDLWRRTEEVTGLKVLHRDFFTESSGGSR